MATGVQGSQTRLYPEYELHTMTYPLVFSDNNSPKALPIKVPSDALIFDVRVAVTVAFNDTGTDLVKVGITSGGSELAAAVDVSSVGVKLSTTLATAVTGVTNPQSDTTVYAQYNGANSDMTAGAAFVIVTYLRKG